MKMKPVHPGEILVEEFLVPMGISQYRLAKEIHVPLRRVNEIALGRRGISADTALPEPVRDGRCKKQHLEGHKVDNQARAWSGCLSLKQNVTLAGVCDILSNTPRGKSLAISSAPFGILSTVKSVPKSRTPA